MKKFIALLLCAAALCLCACGTSPASAQIGAVYEAREDVTEVVCLFDPDCEDIAGWEAIAALYTEETGIPVRFVSAGESYEETLSGSLLTMDAPVLFQVKDRETLAVVDDFCYDMSESEFFSKITDRGYALYSDEAVHAAALNVKTYGLAVNTVLLEQAGHSMDELTGFAGLKAVAEDITAKRDVEENIYMGIIPLEFSAFCSAPLSGTDAADFAAVLANLPVFRQFSSEEGLSTAPIQAELLDNMKSFLELYIGNSVSTGAEAAKKTQKDAIKEFVDGKAVFCLCRGDAYAEMSGMEGIRIIPMYMGFEGEKKQGLCTGAESYFCINRDADEDDLNAALDFMNWLVSSETGAAALVNDMGYACPYADAPTGKNAFVKQASKYTAGGRENVRWCFEEMPSEDWLSELGSAVSAFASGSGKWDSVQSLFADGWTSAFEVPENETAEQ